jgi:hypothetical protein
MFALRLLVLLGGLLLLLPVAVDAKITVHIDDSGKVHISNEGAEEAPESPPAQSTGSNLPGIGPHQGRLPPPSPPPPLD